MGRLGGHHRRDRGSVVADRIVLVMECKFNRSRVMDRLVVGMVTYMFWVVAAEKGVIRAIRELARLFFDLRAGTP